MKKMLYFENPFYRDYIEYMDENTARHTSFIWSYELDEMIPYDTFTFNYTKYANNWDEYCDQMVKTRKNIKIK